MTFLKRIFLLIIGLSFAIYSYGENKNDPKSYKFDSQNDIYKFKYSKLIAPTILISAGILGLENNKINSHLRDLKDYINDDHFKKIKIDDYTRFVPMLELYGLNFCGIKGEHNFVDRTIILLNATIINTIFAQSIKRIVSEERPNFTDNYSFPSGHTALTFMGAEMLRKEYKDVTPWIGISGYLVAASTAYLRVYNNKHWIQDTFAGAGLGILSTDISYYLFPYIHKILFKDLEPNSIFKNTVALPYVTDSGIGICANIRF